MRIDVAFPVVVLATLLGACDDSGETRESVIGEPLQQSLERARAVEDTVQEQAAEMRRRIEESEGR